MRSINPSNIFSYANMCNDGFCKISDESKFINSINTFHPAGHGTFFTGILDIGDGKSSCRFSWVYDCGSRRKNLIERNENTLKDFLNQKIDMICLSHFDSDHINGLETLIQKSKFKIRNLVLPYLPFSQRLETVFKTKSIDVLSFALDPFGHLKAKRLLHKVDRILLIQGSDTPTSNPTSVENPPLGSGKNKIFKIFPKGKQADINDYSPLIGEKININRKKQKEISGNKIKNLGSKWEFVFFNLPLESKNLHPRASISNIHAHVKQILNSSKKDKDKIEQLKRCYCEHFGNSNKNRNDISLCVLSRPLDSHNLHHSMVCFSAPDQAANNQSNYYTKETKIGILLTGDISIDKATINLMKSHFGTTRWNDIGVMQIPHHGSVNSWKIGNHEISQHQYSVLCVPDKGTHHPHDNVLSDLERTTVVRADYSNSVVYKVCSCPININYLEKITANIQSQIKLGLSDI